MRAKEFIVETAMMGKIADSGKIIRILKKAHTVPFSDEKNWLLVDTDPGKGNSGLGIKWIPADTRFEWVRPYKDSVDENLSPQIIHKLADHKGVKWDDEPSFLQLTKRLTGKEHLDDLDQAGLNKVKKHLDGLQGVAEGSTEAAMSNAVTFFRGEPILSQERLNQLKSSIGKPYPILRKEGSAANIGTYMSPDGKKATSFVQQALAGQGAGGTVTQIQVDPNSFSKGDGGIDEAVIITNIAGLVSDQKPNENDPLRIQDRKQAMLKYLGPGVQKYLNDPLLTNPNLVQRWYNPEFAQKNWNTINSGKQAVTKPGESEIQERMISVLGSLAEKIRRDPEVISYFIGHNPGNWIEYNFRMNSDGSGTKVVDVKYYPPAKSGVAEGLNEFAQGDFNGGDDGNDLQLYLNVAKKLNMKKYKPSTAHNLIAKKMAELVDAVDDEKVDWARHMARKAQGLPSMLDEQGVAESDLDKYKKYIRPVVKSTPKIEKDNTPSGRTTDHIEWKVTSPTGEIHRYSSKKQAQAKFDSFGPQGVAEGSSNNIPTIGINVRNDGNIDYASLIVDGGKKYESRKTDSLRPYVGKTVGIVRTGNGPAVAIGQVTIGEPIVVDAEKFNRLRKQHLVPQGSKFDIDSDGKKYLYPMIDPVRWDNEKTIKHRGIVSRKIQEQGVAEGLK